MKSSKDVKRYFEDTAKDFDEIYDNQGDALKRLINRIFRRGMRERLILALQECTGDNKTILDIGCGSGRISLLLAEKGAKVTGIDYSLPMIELAKEHLKKYEASKNIKLDVEFICCDFLEDFDSDTLFDITLALGVFDYIKYPMSFLEKIRNLTREKMIASYPAKFAFQMPIRKVWLHTKNCPVYFYTERQLASTYRSIGVTNYEIVKISAGYFVKAYVIS